jgi:hypothetical protein
VDSGAIGKRASAVARAMLYGFTEAEGRHDVSARSGAQATDWSSRVTAGSLAGVRSDCNASLERRKLAGWERAEGDSSNRGPYALS